MKIVTDFCMQSYHELDGFNEHCILYMVYCMNHILYILPVHSQPVNPQEYCQALYDFHPQNSDEILLTVGKRIKIINKDDGKY